MNSSEPVQPQPVIDHKASGTLSTGSRTAVASAVDRSRCVEEDFGHVDSEGSEWHIADSDYRREATLSAVHFGCTAEIKPAPFKSQEDHVSAPYRHAILAQDVEQSSQISP